MSKLLLNLVLCSTKVVVNAYTWPTLPFYAIRQRPWARLKRSQAFGVQSTVDKYNRTIYSRPLPDKTFSHPVLQCNSFNEMVPHLNRTRNVIGIRDVLSEVAQLDATGKPIQVDSRELKKVTLANEYRWCTVEQVMDRVDALARGFEQIGIRKGEKVALFADNSFEWFCTALALQRINAVTITLLSILNNDGFLYGLNQCNARYLITSQELLVKRISTIANSLATPLSIIYIESPLKTNNGKLKMIIDNLKDKQFAVMPFSDIEAAGKQIAPYDFPIPDPADVAVVMYTSGTTGFPKGVVMTHKNIATGVHNLLCYDRELENPLLQSRIAGFLPFAHIFGFMLHFGMFIDKGEIALCSAHTLLDSSPAHVPGQVGDITLHQPEYISLVPLVLERLLKEIYRQLNARSPLAAPLFTYFMDYKIYWRSRGYDTPLINRLISQKINERFGGKLKIITIGSAPLNERTHALAQAALNIQCIQGYGSTEMTAGATIMHNDDLTYGASGVPFNSVKFYLKDWPEGGYYSRDLPNPRGEIIVGGDNITVGYYKMPEETAESFTVDDEGTRWFASGDIGELLPNGTLKIIDRKKDLTKLANGEFISLGKIESALRSSPYIDNICICTWPYANYVIALIQPNKIAITALAATLDKANLSFEQICGDVQIKQLIQANLQEIGRKLDLASKEVPVEVYLATEEWTQDNNLMTAAMKLKRKQVNEFYKVVIEKMFSETDF